MFVCFVWFFFLLVFVVQPRDQQDSEHDTTRGPEGGFGRFVLPFPSKRVKRGETVFEA